MAEYNLGKTTTPNTLTDYSVDLVSPDSPIDAREAKWYNSNFTKWFGHYTKHSKIKKSIDAYATWVLGQGFETDIRTKVILDHVDGWGEDTFISVLWNMLVMKKVNGDSYAQRIKDKENFLINLKPLNPQHMIHVVNGKGRIVRYEYKPAGSTPIIFQPNEILHLCNDRVADEIHGRSVIEAVEWNVEACEEAKRAHRKMQYRNGIVRVIEVDTDDTTKINTLKTQWATAIEKGDVLIIPKGVAEAKDWHGTLNTQDVLGWLRYLDDDFYISIGIPKAILGGTSDSTEASAKIATLNFDPLYLAEKQELEQDLWKQLGIKVLFGKQPSLLDNMQTDEAKNTGQLGYQQNDVQAGKGDK